MTLHIKFTPARRRPAASTPARRRPGALAAGIHTALEYFAAISVPPERAWAGRQAMDGKRARHPSDQLHSEIWDQAEHKMRLTVGDVDARLSWISDDQREN